MTRATEMRAVRKLSRKAVHVAKGCVLVAAGPSVEGVQWMLRSDDEPSLKSSRRPENSVMAPAGPRSRSHGLRQSRRLEM